MSISQIQIPTAIERALGRFYDSLDAEEMKMFSQCTTENDIWTLAKELEEKQGERRSLRALRRIEPFITGISQYAGVIEVFVQVKPDILGVIWGPLKFMLQLASTFTDSFDRLLDACQKIGQELPRFTRFARIFQYSDRVQHVISLVYEDILDFLRRALKFFRRRAWKIMFNLFWNTFESRIGLTLRNLQKHQILIDNEASAEDIEQSHIAREKALEKYEEEMRDKRTHRKKLLCDWLQPPDMETTKDRFLQLKTPGTNDWLLRSKDVENWFSGKRNTIWLTGKPGAGKTVLSASLIDEIESRIHSGSEPSSLLYFFCSYKQPDKNNCLALLRSLIWQRLLQDSDLIPYVYDLYINNPNSASFSRCKKLLNDLLGECTQCGSHPIYVILDGLDELPEAERKQLFPVLKPILAEEPFVFTTRVYIASQDLVDIRKALKKSTSVPIKDNNKGDIRKYIEAKAGYVIEELGLEDEEPDLYNSIVQSLSSRADGMFLWVRLVIEGILSQTTPAEVKNAISNLPVGLDQAYERILDRINSKDPKEQIQAKRLLQWMTCSTHILTLRELEDALAIRPSDLTVDKDERPYRVRLGTICGPIVEVVGEDSMVFVHFSAKEYLLDKYSGPFIDRLAAHLDIAQVCTTYQSFSCFNKDITDQQAVSYVMNGDLRLFRYIRSSWITHILHACALSKDKAQLEPLSNALQRLFSDHFLQGESIHSDMTLESHTSIQVRSGGRDISLRNLPPQEQLRVKKVVEYNRALEQKTGSEYTEWANVNDPMDISKRGRILQDVLEGILEDRIQPELLAGSSCNYIEVLQKLYGQKLYKCRSPSCEASLEVGFETSAQRQLHEDKHARPYKCPSEDCFFKEVGFATKSALQKHRKDYHNNFPAQRTRRAKNLELLDRAKSVLRPGTPQRDQPDNDQLDHDINFVPIIVDNFLTDVDQESISPSHKKEGASWIALFNPQISRELDVEFLHTLGNDDTVSDIGFSLDGRYIAVAASSSAEIYDVQTGEYVGTFKEDLIEVWNETIHSVRFSPDGKYLVTGGMNRNIMLWSVQDQMIRHRFIGHRQSINSVDFATNGNYIVSGSADRTIRVWDVYTGKNLLTLSGDVSVRSVAFSPNGKLIAAGSDSGEIHVWDSRSGHLQNQFSGHNSSVYSVSFSPLGVELFSGSMDGKVKIWPLAPTLNANQTFKHEKSVNSVASTPDGKWLLSASGGYVHFWQPATSNCHLGLETYTYMNYPVSKVATCPTGGFFATVSDGLVRIWRYREIAGTDVLSHGSCGEVNRSEDELDKERTDRPIIDGFDKWLREI